MPTCIAAILCAATCFAAAPLFEDDFKGRVKWEEVNVGDRVRIEFGSKWRGFSGLAVTGMSTVRVDTAWSVRSPRRQLPVDRAGFFSLAFDVAPEVKLASTVANGQAWQNAVLWYGADGKEMERCKLDFMAWASAGGFRTVRLSGPVPLKAVAFAIQIGFDGPNLWGGKRVVYKNLTFRLTDSMRPMDVADRGDFMPPRVKVLSPSPTVDRRMKPSFAVTDASLIDWRPFRVVIDGTNVTMRFRRKGNVVSWKGDAEWSDGIHAMDVTVADVHGNMYTAKKRFFIGEAPKVPKVRLRDDGMTLVDGKPFFPIGIYGVMRREFNGNNMKKAFEGLADGGFNAAHSYGEARTPEFISESARHGFRIWMETRMPDVRFVERERHYPHVLAWYLGDDTSRHEHPWMLIDYNDATKAVDPNRITCQADAVSADAVFSAYHDYVDGTDVFLPEIYPMKLGTEEENRECVARVIRDMKCVAKDIRTSSTGRPHGIWPIIQYFQGWGWKHFPTREELFGMTFAAICHGANGMTWYAYCGRVRPERKQYNYGVTSTPERWKNICDIATRLKELSPVLTERSVRRFASPVVLNGPERDPLGNPSISCLAKRHAGETYLIAVNSAAEKVAVRFDVGVAGAVDVLYENRVMRAEADGFCDEFAPFGVHIYKMRVAPRDVGLDSVGIDPERGEVLGSFLVDF